MENAGQSQAGRASTVMLYSGWSCALARVLGWTASQHAAKLKLALRPPGPTSFEESSIRQHASSLARLKSRSIIKT